MSHCVAGRQESLDEATGIRKGGSLRLECKLPSSRSTLGCDLANTQVTKARVVLIELSNTSMEVGTAAMQDEGPHCAVGLTADS
jgi:hypothetical protein